MPLDDAAITAFLDLVFDHACAQPLSTFVDADRVLSAIETVANEPRVSMLHQRILGPLCERLIARGKASTLTLAAWIPEPLVEPIADLIGAEIPLPPKMIDDLVASEEVRDEVRAMLSDALSNFIKKATGGGGEKAGSLRDVLGRGARTFGAVGKGLLGGLGDELQKQMQERVRDFVDGSVAALQERIAKKLKSEETTKSLAKRRRKGFLKLLQKKESEAAGTLEPIPFAAIDALAPMLVAHNVRRTEIHEALKAEIGHVLKELGAQTVGEHLDELGLRDQALAALHAHGTPFGKSFMATPAFQAWFDQAKK
jgi:hypothetical protein